MAARYAEELIDELDHKPLDRALLSVIAEDARSRGLGPIGDLGAGPGHVAAFLAGLGATVVTLDLSPAMAAIARHRLGLAAVAGSLTSLPFGRDALGGAVAFYCLIHLDEDGLDAAAHELARVVGAGGPLLVAFHVGEEVRHLDEWWDEEVDVDFRFLEAAPVADRLERAGFAVEAVLERASYPEEVETRRSYILGRRRTS
ncbi:MAG TPA: class I SAM-dependent methyltransferase [Acidimicrobiales bacterium]|nr:class I SAM-dependent methyltransferase [Acidimicrobiales bacterium]